MVPETSDAMDTLEEIIPVNSETRNNLETNCVISVSSATKESEIPPKESENPPKESENPPKESENPPKPSKNLPKQSENSLKQNENPPKLSQNHPKLSEIPPIISPINSPIKRPLKIPKQKIHVLICAADQSKAIGVSKKFLLGSQYVGPHPRNKKHHFLFSFPIHDVDLTNIKNDLNKLNKKFSVIMLQVVSENQNYCPDHQNHCLECQNDHNSK